MIEDDYYRPSKDQKYREQKKYASNRPSDCQVYEKRFSPTEVLTRA